MVFRNSLRQVFRSPVRTSLFVILLTAVSALLSVGINLHFSAVNSIELADEAFTTIGTISFKNLDNPDLTLNDIMNYDFSPIVNSEHVRLLDRRIMLAGVAEGVKTVFDDGSVVPSKTGVMYSIIEFTPVDFSDDGERTFIRLQRVLHSYKGYFEEGKVLRLEQRVVGERETYKLEMGKKYVTCGFEGYLGGYCSVSPGFSEVVLKRAGLLQQDASFAQITEVKAEDYWASEEGLLWDNLAAILQNSVQTLSVYTTNDLETMLIFHQGNALISSGRAFSQTEYEEGAKVCIMNAATAKHNGFQVGDRISLAFSEEDLIFYGGGALVDSVSPVNNNRESYEIIGFYTIITNMENSQGLYEDTVFVPQRSVPIQPDSMSLVRGHSSVSSTSVTGEAPVITEVHLPEWENFVSFRLTNGSVEAFKKEMEPHNLSGLTFAFDDQGYSKVNSALIAMKETATILTAICSSAGLGIALLFSLLFVGRQQRSIAIMYTLGTGKKKALALLMLSVLMVVGLAVSIGGITGYILSDTVLAETYNRNMEVLTVDSSFSGISGDTGVGFHVAAPPGHHAPLAAAGAVMAATLIFSGFFAASVLKAEPMQVLAAKEE